MDLSMKPGIRLTPWQVLFEYSDDTPAAQERKGWPRSSKGTSFFAAS
jgi:hypothetical protein